MTVNKQILDKQVTGTPTYLKDRWNANRHAQERHVTGEVIDQEILIINQQTLERRLTGIPRIEETSYSQTNRPKRDRWQANKIYSRETGERWMYRSKGTGDMQTYRSWRDRWQMNTDSRETSDRWRQIQERQVTGEGQVTVEHWFKRDRWQARDKVRVKPTWNISGEDNSKLRSSAETYFLWRSKAYQLSN